MCIFCQIVEMFKPCDINEGVKKFHESQKDGTEAVLLDVRTKAEFDGGHIKGSINLEVADISKIAKIVPNKNIPIFVYCRSGARSGGAVNYLKQAGYTNAQNIGGVLGYKGTLEV